MTKKVKLFSVNGQKIPLVYKRDFLKTQPFTPVNVYRLTNRRSIPTSMFYSHGFRTKTGFRLYELYTSEHCALLGTWFQLVTDSYVLPLKPTAAQVAWLHKEWLKIDEDYKEKYSLPVSPNISDFQQKYLTLDLAVIKWYSDTYANEKPVYNALYNSLLETCERQTVAYTLQYKEGDVYTAFFNNQGESLDGYEQHKAKKKPKSKEEK